MVLVRTRRWEDRKSNGGVLNTGSDKVGRGRLLAVAGMFENVERDCF